MWRESTLRLIAIKGNQLVWNGIFILIKNVCLFPARQVLFLIKRQKNKNLYVFSMVPYFKYIHSIWCIHPFSTCSLIWCSTTNWSWQHLKDQDVSFPSNIKYDAFIFYPDLPKYNYIQIGLKDVSIGQAPEKIVVYNNVN